MSFICHPCGGERTNGIRWKQAARKVKNLAFSVLGSLSEQDDRAWLDELCGKTERSRTANLRKQIYLFCGIGITLKNTVEQSMQQ